MLAGLVVFIGSFLLFMVQPMLGRTLLPAFGGTAAVWTTCLAAYQLLLLAGYFYAHLLAKSSGEVRRAVHLVLLVGAVIWSGVLAVARPLIEGFLGRSGVPSVEVLLAVCVLVGLPYVLLASGSSLIQDAVASKKGRGAYRLYAVSNLGSFLGLFFYPIVLEPFVSVSMQWWLLCGGLFFYVGLMGFVLPRGNRDSRVEVLVEESRAGGAPWLWFVLPGISCFMLNAVTAHLTLDVMPLPLLWAVLLGLFLLSYVVGFSAWAERCISIFGALALISAAAAGFTHALSGTPQKFALNLSASCAFCFFGCTFIHSWLYSLRPERNRLTFYYLGNAVGGAVGGSLASLAAPMIFRTIFEFPIALGLLFGVIALFAFIRWRQVWRRMAVAGVIVVACGIAFSTFFSHQEDRPVIYRARGFFGTLEVLEAHAKNAKGEGLLHEFIHGTTVHGIQTFLPGQERMPTTYFTPDAGGYAVTGHWKYRENQPMRVNILGLGIGVMLAYARPGDFYRAYEISPEALAVAQNPALFTFASGCPATLELALEDARKGLEAELAAGTEPYDVIMIDAFTGDNLPYHLSTVEAFELYFKMLKPDGVLAINISNWHLDLEPYIKALGDHFNCPVLALNTPADMSRVAFSAKFAFFCRDPRRLAPPPRNAYILDFSKEKAMPFVPTDEKGSFISLIRY